MIQKLLSHRHVGVMSALLGNAPKNPLTSEVEFFPKERVLYEEIEIH